MKNMDELAKEKAEITAKIQQAVKDGDDEAFQEAFLAYTETLQDAVMAEAKGLVQAADNHVLAGRGARSLTSTETKFYESLITAMSSRNPHQALADIDVVLPETVIDAVFEDITEAHPLLDAINFQFTGALVEIIVSTLDGRQMAAWGRLTDEIVKELSAGFTTINLAQKKLSAFIPIAKPMLDLGPKWIDRYIRAHLSEAIFNGLEHGIIDGSGIDMPIGMRRDPNSALDPEDGYDALEAQALNEITPATFGELIAQLSVAPTGLQRNVRELIFVVNPKDYFSKIFAATTHRLPDGTYANNIFPFPTKLIQSVFVPDNEAIVGLGRRYFMGLGTGKDGKIEYSDEHWFLKDERVYLTKLYGDGKPLDNKSFIRLDITNLRPAHPVVQVSKYLDASLSVLEIKDKVTSYATAIDLSPAFSGTTHYYTAAIADDTNDGDNDAVKLYVTAKDENAVITAMHGDTDISAKVDGSTAITLVAGPNVITVTVTVAGRAVENYTIVIEYTPKEAA